MRTKNIFKTVALAMLMPAMLLTTACSSEDDLVNNTVNSQPVANKGYALPVTVNVTRGGDATRATFDGSKLNFGDGDKLFVSGSATGAGSFAGTLTWQSGGTFSGTIYTESPYEGTIDDILNGNYASLLPAGYDSYDYLEIIDEGYEALLGENAYNSFATSKKLAVEQLSFEHGEYTSGTGFVLMPQNAILNFTITGFVPNTKVMASLSDDDFWTPDIEGEVTTDGSGNATFAIGLEGSSDLNEFSLSVAGNAITLVSSSTPLAAGHVYNITRGTGALINLADVTDNTEAQNGDILTGTLDANVKISIADGATVILNNVNINGTNDSEWAGITCLGDATIILSGTNTVKGFYEDYPGIQAAAGKTLTINGTGSLTASSNGWGAGIGGGYQIVCGNIEIQGGTITAMGGDNAAGIGSGASNEASCGDITISGGTVTATGGHNGPGIGSGGNEASCGDITISGGNVTAIAGTNAAAIGKPSDGTCTSVTITPAITRLTLTNTNDFVTGIVRDFINATAVNANTTPITTMLLTSVTDPAITGGMTSAGFATSYNDGAKTWTITKN